MKREERAVVGLDHIRAAQAKLSRVFAQQIKEKGSGAFVSSHEILGTLQEEVHEFEHAVEASSYDDLMHGLRDVAVVCLWGLASGEAEGLHWPLNPHSVGGLLSSKWPEDRPEDRPEDQPEDQPEAGKK